MTSIQRIAPNRNTFSSPNLQHSSTGRITALALGADGSRMYAGSFAGVWRSDDGGQNFYQLIWPQPGTTSTVDIAGALLAPHIFDLAASPTDLDVVLACALDSQLVTNADGIYRSADGGRTWALTLGTKSSCNIAFAPDDSQLVYVALGSQVAISQDAGVTWRLIFVPGTAWHIAVGPLEASGVRRIYTSGDSTICYSSDGGNTWDADLGVATIRDSRAALSDFIFNTCGIKNSFGGFSGATAYAVGTAAQVLAVEPGNPAKVYLAAEGAANGPTFYSPAVADGTLCNTVCARLAGEASLWYGDFSQFDGTKTAQWAQLPGPPVYVGATTPSGNCYVATKSTSVGFLVFFSDNSHVHVSQGTPLANNSWHRLDGLDASAVQQAGNHSNTLLMHVDPHAIAFSNTFEISLTPATGVPTPFDQNSVLNQYLAGTIWLANDGGVNWSADGGQTWNWPFGLETLDPVNIAGLFGIGATPALYFGCGDNDDFFTVNGGVSWGDPNSSCGDCDAWFSDIDQPGRAIQFLPRGSVNGIAGAIGIINSPDPTKYPDPSVSANEIFVPSTRTMVIVDPMTNTRKLVPYASSGLVIRGYRPVILTMPTEGPLPDGDYVFIDQALDGTRRLLRTTAISSIAQLTDWADPIKAPQIGPLLPTSPANPAITPDIVQTTGGHVNPTYFVGTSDGYVWRFDELAMTWVQIIPQTTIGNSIGQAKIWFVDPYNVGVIYALDSTGIKVSTDSGDSWLLHGWLTQVATAGYKIAVSNSILQDMVFSRGSGSECFAFGTAGVFYSNNFGITWITVLNSYAFPGRPESGFFDPISVPGDPAIYVEMEGRSVVRVGDLPPLPPFEPPPPPFDLMEFAAIFAD